MKAICPNNKDHKRFSVVCHVTEEWEVDENGNFIKLIEGCIDVIHGPSKDTVWCCMECGSEAIIEE